MRSNRKNKMSAVKALERLGTAAVLLGGAASALQFSMYDGKFRKNQCA